MNSKYLDNETLYANMNNFVVATRENPVIGTFALATCVGLLMYDDHNHFALAHILHDYENIIKNTENIFYYMILKLK